MWLYTLHNMCNYLHNHEHYGLFVFVCVGLYTNIDLLINLLLILHNYISYHN